MTPLMSSSGGDSHVMLAEVGESGTALKFCGGALGANGQNTNTFIVASFCHCRHFTCLQSGCGDWNCGHCHSTIDAHSSDHTRVGPVLLKASEVVGGAATRYSNTDGRSSAFSENQVV